MIKKCLFALFVSAASLLAAAEKTPATAKNEVKKPTDREIAVQAIKNFKLPELSAPGSWTMVIIPDTQTYIKQIENQGILDLMLAWIVRRRAEMNIRQVLFTGDLVYHNDQGRVIQEPQKRFARSGYLVDLVTDEQWKAFSRLMERLDNEVPYILCTGNHDHGRHSAENRNTFFGKYFPTDRNKLTRRQLIECAPDFHGPKSMINSAYEFCAPAPDKRKFLIITLQFAPGDAELKWAKAIADQPRFADHIGIVLTHSYMYANGSRIPQERYMLSQQGGNPGEEIFKKLVYPAKNIRMVVCGHVCTPDNWERGVGFSTDKNSAGKTVFQMVFNTQAIGGGFSGSGGDGWLRLLEFMPDGKTVKARTFSPFFGASPATCHLAWKRDARNEFTFILE